MTRATRAVEFLETRLASGGAQLCVNLHGTSLVDVGVGVSASRPIDASDLVRVWCSAKPVAACVLMALLRARGLSLGDTIRFGSTTSELTWGELLNHSRDLSAPDMMSALLMPRTRRRHACKVALQCPAERPAYSEYVSAAVVADGIAELSDQAANPALQNFLHSMGLGEDILYGALPVSRVAPSQWGQSGARTSGDFRQQGIDFDAAAAGPFANARGLARFYDVVSGNAPDLRVRTTPLSRCLAEMLATRRPRVFDPILSRTCSFGAGFAVGLEDHGYGILPSANSFGHSGAMGSSWAFHDPDAGLSVAFTRTACIFDTGWIDAEREAVVREVYSWL